MYNQGVTAEAPAFLNDRMSRRAAIGRAAGVVTGVFIAEHASLPVYAEEDPHVASYRAFLTESFNGVRSEEGKFIRRFDLRQMADIGYGFVRTIIDNQDKYKVEFAREDFSLSTADGVLRIAGKAHAGKEVLRVTFSGDVNFSIPVTSPEGNIIVNYDAMEVDGTDWLDFGDFEPLVRDKIGDDPNAKFVEYLNKAYKNEFEEEEVVGDAKIFIGDGFVDLELMHAVQAPAQ